MKSQLDEFKRIREKQRKASVQNVNKSPAYRLGLLKQAKKMLEENEDAWLEALHNDLKKPTVEAYASEIGVLLNEIDEITKHLTGWMKPQSKHRLLLTGLEEVKISRKPYGSVLVIAPWNYPLQLALMPVIGALAAGNSVVLKPSEFAQTTSGLLAELVPLYFKEEQVKVIQGDADVAEKLTSLEWDFVFFTGSVETGRKVYKAAAEHLTPVLLELGGKNPLILDETGLNDEAIKQIAWGKFLNAGQSCIAPDTVYVSRPIHEDFLERMTKQIRNFYGKNPSQSNDFGRIIHEKQFKKVASFLKDGKVYSGGATSKEDLYISPTLLVDIKPGSSIATEEIFGPILPVIPYDSLENLLDELSGLSAPLVTYVFSEKDEVIQKVNQQLESGALSQNQVILHSTSPHLPFGGRGQSGLGRYHGQASYEAFSVEKPHYTKKPSVSFSNQFPPYSKGALGALRKFRKYIF